ncbi:tetratricopeptide repeat protein [Streptomyces sp. JJ36]|uniref:tetratricopeptide repeat protein n=1 Tax=Streptomyces sp. JJ36 TaxID=2736645 RepID=UPI001F20FDDF|nr:tetratricopeptide repeat protein [Streptomyces sp. JJ36]MCF6524622.1 tetratricopeptide repeat protein [Streptomyces sp. JJ36]
MASSPSASTGPDHGPNTAFRRLRGSLSPGEFAAAVRRAAREIGEQVACDARYIGRVEAGEIRCPNYAYERVFTHMFPGHSLADMGFAARESVRGRAARTRGARSDGHTPLPASAHPPEAPVGREDGAFPELPEHDEESDVLRRAFMTGGPAALAAVSLTGAAAHPASATPVRVGAADAAAVEDAVTRIRLLDDRHGADGLYRRAGETLRAAYDLLDRGTADRPVSERLHSGAGELALSVGWLAHDSGRFADARSHYAEALATARVAGDTRLEAHAFCNTAFLARDASRPREAVRAAQAGRQAARRLGSPRLLALLALREAGGWAGLGDRSACETALSQARDLFARGPTENDPPWMSFFGEAELEGLESQCWAALGAWGPAARHARRAVALQQPHFVRNRALFTAELAGDLAAGGEAEEAAATGMRALALLGPVRSTRIRGMLDTAADRLRPYHREPRVARFLARQGSRPG